MVLRLWGPASLLGLLWVSEPERLKSVVRLDSWVEGEEGVVDA